MVSPRRFPWLLAGWLLMAYGLWVPLWGFYWDDWTPLLVTHLPQPDLFNYLTAFWGNRPGSGVLFFLLFKILPPIPWIWQIWGLTLRWFVGLATWLLWRQLWPKREAVAQLAALLFAVYPAFRQQPITVAYSPHWLSLGLALLSVWSMLRALNGPRTGRWVTFSYISLTLSFLLIEYALPLEVFRWWLLGRHFRQERGAAKRGLRWLLPYLLLFAMGVLFTQRSRATDVHIPLSVSGLVLRLIRAASSVLYVLVGSWTAYWSQGEWWWRPSTSQWKTTVLPAAWLALLVMALVYRLLLRREDAEGAFSGMARSGIGYALFVLLLTQAPFWAVNRFIYGLYSDRYAMPALFAVPLFWVGVSEFLRPGRPRRLFLSGLLGLALLLQAQHGWTFIRSWEEQRLFYAQLRWRFPHLSQPYALLGQGGLTTYIDKYVAGETVNVLYHANLPADDRLAYWFFGDDDYPLLMDTWAKGEGRIQVQHKGWTFQAPVQHLLLVVHRHSEWPGCVWFLGPWDVDNPWVPEFHRDWLRRGVVLPSLEDTQARSDDEWPVFLAGEKNRRPWCYFYQKADRARQAARWEEVWGWWQRAQDEGRTPRHFHEYALFIQAALHTGRWAQAADLTWRYWVKARNAGYPAPARAYLCRLWEQWPPTQDAAFQETRAALLNRLSCPNPNTSWDQKGASGHGKKTNQSRKDLMAKQKGFLLEEPRRNRPNRVAERGFAAGSRRRLAGGRSLARIWGKVIPRGAR